MAKLPAEKRSKVSNPKIKKKPPKKKKAEMTAFAVFLKYSHLDEKDLQWLGRPAMCSIHSRRYDPDQVKHIAALKKQQMKYLAARRKEFQKAELREQKKQKTAAEKFRATYRAEKLAREIKEKAARRELAQKNEKLCKKVTIRQKAKATPGQKRRSESRLPHDIWCKILDSLCENVELEGVRAPSVIARELCTISMVSKELHAASLSALQHLSSKCRTIKESAAIERPYMSWARRQKERDNPPTTPDDSHWDAFVSDPAAAKTKDLSNMLAAVGLYSSGPKAIMSLDLMNFLGLQVPSQVPARLLLAVAKEKEQYDENLAMLCSRVNRLETCQNWHPQGIYYFDKKFNCFSLRRDCTTHGIPTMQALQDEADM